MNSKKLLLGAVIAAATTGAQAAPYGFFDARSVAMGNVSVATGNIAIAGLSNPAMLMMNESNDSFALLIPAVGVQVIDNGGMQDLVDEFQVLYDQFEASPSTQTGDAMVAVLDQLDDTALVLNADANVALAYAGNNWAFAGAYRAHADAGATITNVDTTYTLTPGDGPTADFTAVGVLTSTAAFSVATSFNIMGMDLAVGVTPKNVSVDAITFSQNVNTVNVDDTVNDAIEENLGSFSTVDAGLALQVLDSITVGLVAKNLMSETLTSTTLDMNGNPYKFNFDTHMRAGVAYHNDLLTIAADMDLTEVKPLSFEDPSKMLALGVELNAFDFMQLRAGYQTNMASGATDPDLLSAGIGLWLGFHLDLAAVVGSDSSVGAMAQMGFRF
ncbi:MAG: conjugal transfer protein TraF [Gammaproteobacteria bacterium]|nr:conjugal transfer protein TraF [Gammaproteobacteria bacterium]